MKTKSTLFCLVFAFCVNINTANAQVNVQDSLALVDFYNSTNGPGWFDHTNWLTIKPVSTWSNIVVTNGRVTEIWLIDNFLKGTIPSSIGNLAYLRELHLNQNQLSGSIPFSIGNLVHVRGLDLSENVLSGNIPSSIGDLSKLEFLDLYTNKLSGTIPFSIGNLKSIIHIDFSENKLTGSIPSSIGNLITLGYLALVANQLNGSIPYSITNLVNLEYLYLSVNQLTGSIPSTIGKCLGLLEMDLSDNQLSGTIPPSISHLVNLQFLFLSHNQLSGSIPSSIGDLPNLNDLYLDHNQLSGSIPSSMGNLSNLYFLYLDDNQLSESIPGSLSKLSGLDWTYGLDLSRNHFTFDGMEMVSKTFSDAIYAPQKLIAVHQKGDALSVYAGGTLSNNTYKWFKNDVLIETVTGDSVFHPTESGRYHVKVLNSVATQLKLYSRAIDYTAPNKAVIASAENALQQHDKTNLFLVYPNPARDILHVETNSNASFSLLNQSGKILLTKSINGNGEINVANLAAGLYYLRNNATGAVQKVIVAK